MIIKKTCKNVLVIFVLFLFLGSSSMAIKCETENSNNIPLRMTNTNQNIMLTGFWNPTGKMIKSFSTDHYLNPDGWKGENWENLGYDLYSYFPNPDQYNGTFEVDYQKTWDDFWRITSEINPIAIISFGAGNGPWEIEYNARNLDQWISDDEAPYQPTPSPPDDTVETNYVRHSTLPIEEIRDAVNDETNLMAWIDWEGDPGKYLCEYIAYLGMWYQNIHNSSEDPYPCKAAGFIHVNSRVSVEDAIKATEITIRQTIQHLIKLNEYPSTPSISGIDQGQINTPYEYSIQSIDPNNDKLYYYIDWGDGEIEEWIGPYNSGETISRTHIWDEKQTFILRVKAKDEWNAESDWATLDVSISKHKFFDISDNFHVIEYIRNYVIIMMNNII